LTHGSVACIASVASVATRSARGGCNDATLKPARVIDAVLKIEKGGPCPEILGLTVRIMDVVEGTSKPENKTAIAVPL
jgi:hypothetical protein